MEPEIKKQNSPTKVIEKQEALEPRSNMKGIFSTKFKLNVKFETEDMEMKNIFPAYNNTFIICFKIKKSSKFYSDLHRNEFILRHVSADGSTLKEEHFEGENINMISDSEVIVVNTFAIVQEEQKEGEEEEEEVDQKIGENVEQDENQDEEDFMEIKSWDIKRNNVKTFYYKKEENLKSVEVIVFPETKLFCLIQKTLLGYQQKRKFTYFKYPISKESQPFKQLPQGLGIMRKLNFFKGKINQKSAMLYLDQPYFRDIKLIGLKLQEQVISAGESTKKTKFAIFNTQGCKDFTIDCFNTKDQFYAYSIPKSVTQIQQNVLLLQYNNISVKVIKSYKKNGNSKTALYQQYVPARMFLWNYVENTYRVVNYQLKNEENIQFCTKIRKVEPRKYYGYKFSFYPLVLIEPKTLQVIQIIKQAEQQFQQQISYCEYDSKMYIEKSQKVNSEGIEIVMKINRMGEEKQTKQLSGISKIFKVISTARDWAWGYFWSKNPK